MAILKGVDVIAGQGAAEEEQQLGFTLQGGAQPLGIDDLGLDLAARHDAPLDGVAAEQLHFAQQLIVTLHLAELEQATRGDTGEKGDAPLRHQQQLTKRLALDEHQFPGHEAAGVQPTGGQYGIETGLQASEPLTEALIGIGRALHGLLLGKAKA